MVAERRRLGNRRHANGWGGGAAVAVAYAEAHPRREQSGQRNASRLSKQGHAGPRRYLFVAVMEATRHDRDLAAFRDRLVGRDHARRGAARVMMHKLLRRMMGRLRAHYAEHAIPRPLAA